MVLNKNPKSGFNINSALQGNLKRPKIAYLLGSLNRGGTETLMLDMFRYSTSEELDAFCIYRKTGVLENDFQHSSVKMHKLRTGKNIFLYLFQLRKIIKSNNTNIVHAQQPIDAFFAFLACINLNIKILLTLHAYDFTETKFSKIILKFILKRTTLNIYVSDSLKKYYVTKYKLQPKKQETIYNGIGLGKFTNFNSSTIRQELKIDSNYLLLGSVGNFVPGRDQLTICKFLNVLNQHNIPFRFIFIGKKNNKTPERYDSCVEYIHKNGLSEKVHFLGSREDVPELLQQLDAFIYSTEHDTFGIAVVEALACGIPVFVNDWDVMSEITENGKLATLYITKNQEDLFRHFSLFLQNREYYSEKALKASTKVKVKYSIENYISNLKRLYSSLA